MWPGSLSQLIPSLAICRCTVRPRKKCAALPPTLVASPLPRSRGQWCPCEVALSGCLASLGGFPIMSLKFRNDPTWQYFSFLSKDEEAETQFK